MKKSSLTFGMLNTATTLDYYIRKNGLQRNLQTIHCEVEYVAVCVSQMTAARGGRFFSLGRTNFTVIMKPQMTDGN